MTFTIKTAAMLAALALAGPAAASEFCDGLASLGRTQAESRDIGMTREQASRINATADTPEVGELSDVIADVVWGTDLDPDMIEIAVDMACRQAGM